MRGSRSGRSFTIRDQVALRRLVGYAISPDGSRAILVIRTHQRGRNRLATSLWSIDTDGRGLRRLVSADGHASPVFSPDGKSVYYLSRNHRSRSTHHQVIRLPLDGGTPVAVTSAPVDVESFVLSRDGSTVAFSAAVFPGAGSDTLAQTAERLAIEAARPARGHVHDQLFVRHWDEWKLGRRRHIFVQAVAGGPAIDLMPAMDADAPSRPFGGSEEFTFTPDGLSVVFTARDAGRAEAWSTDLDLFIAPIDGSVPPRNLTPENPASDLAPTFSPAGTTLAWLAMDRPMYEADKQTVLLRSWPEGATRRLTDGWDRSAESLAWSADGRTLYVTAQDVGQHGLFAIDVETGLVTPIVNDGHVSLVTPAGDRLFYVHDSLAGPAELHVMEGNRTRQVTHLNASRLRGVALGDAEQFSFPGWNGEIVRAYLVRPSGFDPMKRYPIAFIIHGGPQSSFGNEWHYRWNPQIYAGAGFAVIAVDFHGSTGYGQAFTDSISGDWGGKPVEDLKKGLAAALERYPFLDPSRACALGASFGGYMINLIAGIWNEPWRCLVTHDGTFDERFAYYATEELWFPEWDHGGTPWEKPEAYARDNPIDHVAKWRVPTLVIHGAKDYRVVDVEGLAVFTALQRRGVPSRLLYFPDENHWVSKPDNSVLWHDTVLEWLQQWTADEIPSETPRA